MSRKIFVESLESRFMLSASAAPLVTVPSMVVQGQGMVIAKGDAVPSRQDFTDFGPMSTSGGEATRRFVIQNKGAKPLRVSTLRVGGLNGGDFRIINAPTGRIAPGGQAVVVIGFSPLAAGNRSAKVIIRSNDPSNHRDTFVIQGQGLTTTNLPDGLQYATTVAGAGEAATVGNVLKVDSTGFLLKGTVFDSTLTAGHRPYTFKLMGGTDPLKMQVIPGWDEGMQGMRPGEQRTLFIPPSLGPSQNTSTLVYEVKLLGYGPYLQVLGKHNSPIPSGTTTVRAKAGTEFGTTTKGHSVSRTFVLRTDDPSNANVGISRIWISGTQAGQFDYPVSQKYDYTLGGWTVTVTYKAGRIGNANVTVQVLSEDPVHPLYTFAIHAKTIA